jgi:hypothetical protein
MKHIPFELLKTNLDHTPVLQELIQDLKNKIKMTETIIKTMGLNNTEVTSFLEREVEILEELLDRVEAQQQLINLKSHLVWLN